MNLKNIKIIFIDIDGTLSNSKSEITEYTKSVLKQAVEKGIYVVICSGRTNDHVINKSKQACASSIVISSNGGLIYDYEKDEKIYANEISEETLKKCFKELNIDELGIAFNSTFCRYKINFMKENEFAKSAIEVKTFDEMKKDITQFVIETTKYDTMKKVKEFIESNNEIAAKNWSVSVLDDDKNASLYWMDITKKDTSKGNAITKLLEILKIKKEDSICFGDQMNDYPMFEACGISVAMANGNENLKEKADYIALSNDEDGVAEFIKQNILL